MKSVVYFFLFSFLLTGCGNKSFERSNVETIFVTEKKETVLMSPKLLGKSISEVQILEGTYSGKTYKMNSALKMDAAEMRLIGFSDAVRLFTLVYDGEKITSEFSAFFPKRAEMGPYILWDIQLIYYPISVIKKHLPEMEIKQQTLLNKTVRTIASDGKVIIEITYGLKENVIEFKNLERGYSYKITQLEEDDNA